MGKKVPVPVENIAFERLDLSRHYLTVDCDATCFLVLNPSGEIPIEGTDICALHTGAWQIDAWTLLTKKDFPNQAGFVACLVWDKTVVSDTIHAPQCVESDIDISNSVSTLKGQPVNITGFSMPQGETLPVSVCQDSLRVSDENPLPAAVSFGGRKVAYDNPLPVLPIRRQGIFISLNGSYTDAFLLSLGATYRGIDSATQYKLWTISPEVFLNETPSVTYIFNRHMWMRQVSSSAGISAGVGYLGRVHVDLLKDSNDSLKKMSMFVYGTYLDGTTVLSFGNDISTIFILRL